MPVYAGSFPWSNVSDRTRSGRNRQSMSAGNYEWNLSEGWHLKRPRGWKKQARETGALEKVQLTAPDGRKVTVYRTKGYDDRIGFHAGSNTDDVLALATEAFDKSVMDHGLIFEQEGCGHIAKLEYAQKRLVLRVTFADGAVVIFLGVPRGVAGELLHLAQSKVTRMSSVDGKQRHVLGMVFWDLVRIRGQKHGARYPFEYEKHGVYKLTGSNKRYSVTLSDENIKKVLGSRYYTENLKPGETVRAILSEEEYAKIMPEEHKRAMSGVTMITGNKGEVEIGGVSGDYYADSETLSNNSKGLSEILGNDYGRYLELQQQMIYAQNEAQAARAAELAGKTIDMSEAAKKEIWSRYFADAKTNPELQNSKGKPSLQKITDAVQREMDKHITGNEDFADKRYKVYHEKVSANPARVTVTPHQVFSSDKQALNDYLRLTALIRRADNPAKYAASKVGRPWSIQQLKDMANTYNGGVTQAHFALYNRCLQAGDYEAALNFLKNHKHEKAVVDDKGRRRSLGYVAYASQYDFVVQ